MYTIKEASSRSGVPVASLRAWERRYGVVTPRRTESGYRLYDDAAIAALSTMRRLVNNGWSPAAAAMAIASGQATSEPGPTSAALPRASSVTAHPEAVALTEALLEAASAVDVAA
ncbi:MAG TPA: MerR family transcriptional regulator, partial [Nocardioidaceae bacterium]|nr:MerR family transcriptional regulator [Nocardioidaceae bacterium]